jgi:hypothetical protein
LALQQQRFPRPHLGPGGVVLHKAGWKWALQAWQQGLEGGGEGEAATHG